MTQTEITKCHANATDIRCNGFAGYITKICDGALAGFVEVKLPGGVVCVHTSAINHAA